MMNQVLCFEIICKRSLSPKINTESFVHVIPLNQRWLGGLDHQLFWNDFGLEDLLDIGHRDPFHINFHQDKGNISPLSITVIYIVICCILIQISRNTI